MGSALSFLSPQAFRYFLPAYLLADLEGKLRRVDPTFHLWHGLDDETRHQQVNPQRFGDLAWFEVAAGRFSVFDPEEVEAIVAYLEYKARQDDFSRPSIDQALEN
jgi:hypothetical protein